MEETKDRDKRLIQKIIEDSLLHTKQAQDHLNMGQLPSNVVVNVSYRQGVFIGWFWDLFSRKKPPRCHPTSER